MSIKRIIASVSAVSNTCGRSTLKFLEMPMSCPLETELRRSIDALTRWCNGAAQLPEAEEAIVFLHCWINAPTDPILIKSSNAAALISYASNAGRGQEAPCEIVSTKTLLHECARILQSGDDLPNPFVYAPEGRNPSSDSDHHLCIYETVRFFVLADYIWNGPATTNRLSHLVPSLKMANYYMKNRMIDKY